MSQTSSPQSAPPGSAKLVIVAFAVALLAVIVLNFYIAQVKRSVDQAAFDIHVLTRSVLPGDKLKKGDVKVVRVPNSFKASMDDLGAMSEDELNIRIDSSEVIQQSAAAGDIATFRLFLSPQGRRDFDKNIKEGRRLVSLPVNSRTAPGVLREGMVVDLEAPFNTGDGIAVTLPVMERVRVVAVGTRTVYDDSVTSSRARAGGSFNSITLEVLPEEATALSMIERIASGDFEIQIRNPSDTGTPKIKTGSINPQVLDIISSKRREAPPAPRR